MRTKIILIGYSGHSIVVADVINSHSNYEIVGYIDKEDKENNPLGINYLGGDDQIKKIDNTLYFPAIGDNTTRKRIIALLNSMNLNSFSITSLFSNVSVNSTFGDYCFLARNSIVNTLSTIGNGCIINSGAIIEHECVVSDHAHIGPGAVLCGDVHVGESSFVGANSVVKQGIRIGSNVVIGAGSVVIENIPDNEIWAGNPAKRIISKTNRVEHEISSISILTTADYLQWNELIMKLPSNKQDIYFTPNYHKIQEINNFGKAECFVFKKGNEFVLFPYLKNEISSKFELDTLYYDIESVYGYSGPISNSDNKKLIQEFNDAFEKYCVENNIVCGFTRYHSLINTELNNSYTENKIFDRQTVWVDTDQSIYDIWDNEISSKNRNIIRKAKQNKCSIQILSNPSDQEIVTFVETYHNTMKSVNADDYYFFSYEYIKNSFKLLNKNTYLFNVLNENGQIMCTSMFFHYKDYFHYHLSARTEFADNTSNNFLLYKAVQFAQNLNAKYFHLGGGRSKDENDSLFKFKSSFSNQRSNFYIGKKIYLPVIYNEIILKWNNENPDKSEKYKNILLRYKF